MLYTSNLCTSVSGKYQARANSVMLSLQQHNFYDKWNIDLQIKMR